MATLPLSWRSNTCSRQAAVTGLDWLWAHLAADLRNGTSEGCQHLECRRRACQTNVAAARDWTRSRREGALKPQTLKGSLSGAARNELTIYAGNSPVRSIRSARGNREEPSHAKSFT